MFKWVERSTLPDFNNEMIHYRNAMVREINFAFSDKYSKDKSTAELQEKMERLKDAREKTANRIQRESDRNKVWFELFYDVFRNSLDFTSADLLLKYFNIPNEVVFADFYYMMKGEKSPYSHIIRDHAYNTAFEFLRFFPASDALHEYTRLLNTAADKEDHAAVLFLIDHLDIEPFDRLLKDEDTRKILIDQYKKAEYDKRIADARKIANILNEHDLMKRTSALEAMMNKHANEAVGYLKEIREIGDFKAIVKEFYKSALNDGHKNNNMDRLKTAYEYALYGKLDAENEKYLQEPAGYLFEYYLSKAGATEADYFEADKYLPYCDSGMVQDVVAKKMLELIKNNQTKQAKHLKERFNVDFQPGEYKLEKEVRKVFKSLTETSGVQDIPKGEENLLTALDIARTFNFPEKEIEEIKTLLCKFFMVNKMYEKARKFFVPTDRELYEMVINQLQAFINSRDYKAAYTLSNTLKLKFTNPTRSVKKRELKELASAPEMTPDQLAKAISIDDIFKLDTLQYSFYLDAFEYGLTAGQQGIQLLVDLNTAFMNKMGACEKIKLSKKINALIAQDRISADLLQKSYKDFAKPAFFDYVIYILKKLLGIC